MITTQDVREQTWAEGLEERELKLIRDCMNYAADPSGLPGGGIMLLLAKMINRLDGVTTDNLALVAEIKALRPRRFELTMSTTVTAAPTVETERPE